MISLEKWMILRPWQKLTTNVGDSGKIIVVKWFEWLPKVKKSAQSGPADCDQSKLGFFDKIGDDLDIGALVVN